MPTSPSCDGLLRLRTRQLGGAIKPVKRGSAAGVHAARVATRRLRELVPLLALDGDHSRRLMRRLRKAGRGLGRVRDVDIRLAQIDALLRAQQANSPTLLSLRDGLRRKAERRRKRLVAGKLVRRLVALIELLSHTGEDGGEIPPARLRELRWAQQARVVRRAGDLRRAIAHAGAIYEPDALHRVRMSAKKLRYTLEVATHAEQGRYAADLRLLVRVQTVLGRQHDAQELLDMLAAEPAVAAATSEAASFDVAQVVAVLDGRCHRLHARYLSARPSLLELCARLETTASRASRQRRKVS